jgi:hypothetical protein
VVRVEVDSDAPGSTLRIRVSSGRGSGDGDRHRRAITIDTADAHGRDRRITVQGKKVITIDTRHSGGWYNIALSTSSDPAFSYQLAGRLESGTRLTSDPQLGRQ